MLSREKRIIILGVLKVISLFFSGTSWPGRSEVQVFAVVAQPGHVVIVVGAERRDQPPEPRAMVAVAQVAEFVDDDGVDHRRTGHHQPVAERDGAGPRATAPASHPIAHDDPRRAQSRAFGEVVG